jgi:hypothetical protein
MRRFLLLVAILSALASSFALTGYAGESTIGHTTISTDGRSRTVIISVTSTPGGGGSGGGGGGGEQPRPSCPSFESQPIRTPGAHVEIRPDGSKYVYMFFRCNPNEQFRGGLVCVENCPQGPLGGGVIEPPDAAFVWAYLEGGTVPPIPQFAPPLHRNPDLFAVVGKRLYFSVDPGSFVAPDRRGDYPGGYSASATYRADTISLSVAGQTATCQGPGPDATEPSQRREADSLGCYVIIQDRPEGGTAVATTTVRWTVTVTSSNVPGVDASRVVARSTNSTINIKELQAVIVG